MPKNGLRPPVTVLEPDKSVSVLLDVVRRHMHMDVVLLGMWEGDLLVIQVVSGDGVSFGLAPGVTLDLGEEVRSESQTGDTISGDTRYVSDAISRIAEELGIGSYITIRTLDADGQPYGLLSCLAHQPRPRLHERDRAFMVLAVEFLRDEVIDLKRVWEARSRVSRAVCAVLDAGGPTVVFQPIVRLATGAVVGVEALSRFPVQCDDRPCNTEDWFAAAKVVDLGTNLEMAAIHRALRVLPELPAEVTLAVNASPSVVVEGLPGVVCSLPDRGRLVVEITEHENCVACPGFLAAVGCLRDHGVRIAVDDTGAGYSGLDQLLQLRPDIIKVDYVIIRGMDHDPARRTIAVGLVRLTEEIGGTVIAEGIETTAERKAAITAGIPYGQGYLLGKPTASASAACVPYATRTS